ncbi:prepilin-type N-terminal cleavage/methylation domain-containing protein [Candidatus Omnitrophota bacterium]
MMDKKGVFITLKGFTLVELVIALAVLVIGLVGIIAVIPLGQKSAKDAAIISRATMVATEKISEIKAYGYIMVAEEPPSFDLSGTKEGINWEVVIEDVLASDFVDFVALPVQDLKKITVTVTYTVNSKTRQDVFRSFVADF